MSLNYFYSLQMWLGQATSSMQLGNDHFLQLKISAHIFTTIVVISSTESFFASYALCLSLPFSLFYFLLLGLKMKSDAISPVSYSDITHWSYILYTPYGFLFL